MNVMAYYCLVLPGILCSLKNLWKCKDESSIISGICTLKASGYEPSKKELEIATKLLLESSDHDILSTLLRSWPHIMTRNSIKHIVRLGDCGLLEQVLDLVKGCSRDACLRLVLLQILCSDPDRLEQLHADNFAVFSKLIWTIDPLFNLTKDGKGVTAIMLDLTSRVQACILASYNHRLESKDISFSLRILELHDCSLHEFFMQLIIHGHVNKAIQIIENPALDPFLIPLRQLGRARISILQKRAEQMFPIIKIFMLSWMCGGLEEIGDYHCDIMFCIVAKLNEILVEERSFPALNFLVAP